MRIFSGVVGHSGDIHIFVMHGADAAAFYCYDASAVEGHGSVSGKPCFESVHKTDAPIRDGEIVDMLVSADHVLGNAG